MFSKKIIRNIKNQQYKPVTHFKQANKNTRQFDTHPGRFAFWGRVHFKIHVKAPEWPGNKWFAKKNHVMGQFKKKEPSIPRKKSFIFR